MNLKIIIFYNSLFMVTCILFTGCVGTPLTRRVDKNNDAYWCGKYPYKAVVEDARLMFDDGCKAGIIAPMAFLSLPVDIAVDTVMIPVDLFAWCLGKRRKSYYFENWVVKNDEK